VPDNKHHCVVGTEWQRLQCLLAVVVVRFFSHRTFSVQKVGFLKLKTVRMLIRLLYLMWTYIIDKRTALFWVVRRRTVSISYRRFETIYRSQLQVTLRPLMVVPYRRFRTTYLSHLQGTFWPLIGPWRRTDRLYRNVCKKFPLLTL
jgi:hypothetical protein